MSENTAPTLISRKKEIIEAIWKAARKGQLPRPLHGDTFPFRHTRHFITKNRKRASLTVEQETKNAPISYVLAIEGDQPRK